MDKVSVVIVNWNGSKFLHECFDSLRQQTYKHFSIVFVDNGSDDDSIDFVTANYPEVKTIALPKNLGFAAANNIAFKNIHTKYVALLNNDTVVHELWLEKLVEALETYSEAGLAASKMLFYNNPETIDRTGDSYSRAGAGILRGRGASFKDYNDQEWIFGACGGAALLRNRMLRDIGFFDEDFFLLYEDVDLSFRAQLMGYRCFYVPEAIVFHKVTSSIIYDSPVSVYYGHRNLEWVYIKNMPAKLILKTLLSHIIYDMAAFLFFVARGNGRDFINAKWDAIKGIKKVVKKRRIIQRKRKMDDEYIWRLLDNELFFPRLKSRLQKSG